MPLLPNHDLWTFALFTGMRAGEIAGLKQDCVYVDRISGGHQGFIEVRRSVEQKTLQLVETTKNGDRRIIGHLSQLTTDRYSHANEDSLGQAVGDFLVNQRKSNNLSLER
jgi:hypothetical protein